MATEIAGEQVENHRSFQGIFINKEYISSCPEYKGLRFKFWYTAKDLLVCSYYNYDGVYWYWQYWQYFCKWYTHNPENLLQLHNTFKKLELNTVETAQ